MTDPATYTEYGFRTADGSWHWPDGDGDLEYGGGNYVRSSDAPFGYRPGVPVDVEAVRRVLPEGAVLVTRRWMATEPEVVPLPIPTTPGSVVSAATDAYARKRLLVLLDYPGDHWRELSRAGAAAFYSDDQLRDVEVLFDAKATS